MDALLPTDVHTDTPLNGQMFEILNVLPMALIAVESVEQHIIYASPTAVKLFAYDDAAELVGQPLDIIIPIDRRGAHRQHVKRATSDPDSPSGIMRRGSVSRRKHEGYIRRCVPLRRLREALLLRGA